MLKIIRYLIYLHRNPPQFLGSTKQSNHNVKSWKLVFWSNTVILQYPLWFGSCYFKVKKLHNVVSSSVNKWWSLWGVSGSVTRGGSVGDWMVTFCKCFLLDQYVEEFKMVIFTLKLKRIGIKNLNVASVIAYLSQWLSGSSSFVSPWWSRGLLVQAPLGTALARLVVLLDPHSSHILYQIFC